MQSLTSSSVNEIAAFIQGLRADGEVREVNGVQVERRANGSFALSDGYVSPPRSRTRPAGASVQATAQHLVA